jgi:hypothetical protein
LTFERSHISLEKRLLCDAAWSETAAAGGGVEG